jgi:amino acid permease
MRMAPPLRAAVLIALAALALLSAGADAFHQGSEPPRHAARRQAPVKRRTKKQPAPLAAQHIANAPGTKRSFPAFFPAAAADLPPMMYKPMYSLTSSAGHVLHPYAPQSRVTTTGSSALAEADAAPSCVPTLSISLVKSIVGGSVFCLPAAVGSLGDSVAVLPMAIAMIGALSMVHAYYFSLLGRVASWTGATTYKQAWEQSVGDEHGAWVGAVVLAKTALAVVCYSMILADSTQLLLQSAGWDDVSRTAALVGVTSTLLLPASLQKDLTALAPFSAVGVAGMVFTAGCMVVRCLDETYAPGGVYFEELPDNLQPAFGPDVGPHLAGIVLACTLATAFVAHYNAPRFYNEMVTFKDSDDTSSTERNNNNNNGTFDVVTYASFGVSCVLVAVTAVAGFETFGSHAQPLILNNYSPNDSLMTFCRGIIALSLCATFPLPFVGLRDGVMDLLVLRNKVDPKTAVTDAMLAPDDESVTSSINNDNMKSENDMTTPVTVALLAAITVVAANVHDLSLVLSVGGGTISTAIASVFPTLMFQAAAAKQQNENTDFDCQLAGALSFMSVGIGATGVTIALQHAFTSA